MANMILESLNLAALVMMGAGFIWKDNRNHLFRAPGWVLMGLYWMAKVPVYLGEDDQFNALGAAMALPVFGYLAFHELNSYKWNDDYPPLRFVTGAMFIAGTGYFVIGHFPLISELMIRIVADQSVWFVQAAGYNVSVGDVSPERALLVGVPVMIVLECTAIQAYFVAGAFLFGCRGDPKKRAMTLALLIPVIWFVNLIRNASVIIMVYDMGPESFDFAHNVLGKGLSFLTLIILVLVAFIQVPELYEDINGLFELPWRQGPKHDYMRFVGRLYKDKKPDGKE